MRAGIAAILPLAAACAAFPGCAPERTTVIPEPSDEPLYGGTLNVGTVYITLSALSWDPVDWTWKSNHDYGLIREQLFAADLAQSIHRGGTQRFIAEAHIPYEALRGELAERWEWEDDSTLVVYLRRGIRFTAKPGVMAARELDAHDVVYSFHLVNDSPKKAQSDYWDYLEGVEARDDHTVVFRFKEFNAEWPYRYGYGYHSFIVPRGNRRLWTAKTGAPSSAPARSNWPTTSKATRIPTRATRTTGIARDSAARSTSSPSWTR